jgi:hypothetical protein
MKKKLKQKITLGIALLLLVIFGVWFFEGRHIVMKVGDFRIYDKDVEYRNKVIKMNYPDEKQDFGLFQLQKSYTNYQILRNYKYTPIEKRLETEAARIDQKTKNPDMLKKIKEIFGKDIAAYQRVFVVPAAVDEDIYYNFFNQQTSFQNESQKRAEDILKKLKETQEPFKQLAEKEQLPYRILQIDRMVGVDPVDLETLKVVERFHEKEKNKKEDRYASYWIDTVLKNVKVGEVASDIVSIEESWLVPRLHKMVNKNVYLVEIIEVPKKTFSHFIEEESKKVPIKTGFFIF